MRTKTSNWSAQVNLFLSKEDETIRKLKEQQKDRKRVNWVSLSQKLNQLLKINRSPKQCRERYESHLKYTAESHSQSPLSFQWDSQQLEVLMNCYLTLGSAWQNIAQLLPKKSENSIKNRFHTLMRKASCNLGQKQANLKGAPKKSITYEIITTLLDLSNQLQKWVNQNSFTINEESKIMSLKREMVLFCFKPEQFTQQRLEKLLRMMKQIGYKLKSFGLFKVSNRKFWKLNEKCIKAIMNFDNFVLQTVEFSIDNSTSVKVKAEQSSMEEEEDTEKGLYELPIFNFTERKIQPLEYEIRDIIGAQSIFQGSNYYFDPFY